MPIDKVNPAAAAGAYANIQKAAQGVTAGAAGGPDFGALLRNASQESIDTIKGGEKASANAVIGKANLTDVVEAVSSAELTLQTVVAVRDKMLGAYQEIMRMPI